MSKMRAAFVMKTDAVLASIDAPLLLPLSPNLSVTDHVPEELVIRTHQALEETYDIIAGVLVDTASFFSYGSLGIASLEAIFEMLRELDLLIVTDAPGCFSPGGVRAVQDTFCDPKSPMFSHAIRTFAKKYVKKQLLNKSTSTIFLNDDHDFIHTSDFRTRAHHPDAFLLFDGTSTKQLRRNDGKGILHVARAMDTIVWKESKEGCIRESFVQCAKDFLSLPYM